MSLLKGKVVAITGAGGGLGRAYALYLAQQGAKIVVNDLGGARDGSGGANSMADAVVKELSDLGAEAVANYSSVATMEGGASITETAVKTFGRLDVLVNNAGIVRDKTLLKLDEEMWDIVIAVHLKGSFTCTLAAAKQMKEQGDGGAIINTTSFAGLKGNFGQTNYAAAKAGIYGMTLVGAMELNRMGVRVNAIAPLAKTRMTEDIDMVPAAMTAEQVAPMVAFLSSDEAKDVTGRIFGVHGGHMFEYKMQTTDGVELGEWTPATVKERLPEIAGQVAAKPAAPAAASTSSAAPTSPQEEIALIFKYMPEGFIPEKAKGWNAVIHWEIAGTGDFTIAAADGKCTSAKGKEGSSTCVVKTDTDTFLGITKGTVDGTQAYMQGKITASNVGDLMKYQKAIDPKKAQAAFDAAMAQGAPATQEAAPSGGAADLASLGPSEQIKLIFQYMPEGFLPEKAKGWTAVIHWEIAGTGDFTITVADGKCSSSGGKEGSSTCVVKTDTDTFLGISNGSVDGTQAYMQGKISATNVGDLMKYQKAIDPKKAQAAFEAAGSAPAPAKAAPAAPPPKEEGPDEAETALESMGPSEKLPLLLGLFPDLVQPASGAAVIHLAVGDLRCTIMKLDDKVAVEPGHVGDATSKIVATAAGLWQILTGGEGAELFRKGEVSASSMADLMWLVKGCGKEPQRALAEELASRGAGLNRKKIGALYESGPIIVTQKEMLDFAASCNEDNPHFIAVERGIVATPLFAVRYFNPIYAQMVMDPELKIDVSRLLFGEMDMRYLRPIAPKDLVVVKGKILSIEDKDTGQIMRFAARLMCEGEVKVDSVASFFVRWEQKSRIKRLSSKSQQEAAPKVAFERGMTYRDDQTTLFSETSQDPNPIHLDENFAKASGMPGIIVHGLCSMSFCSTAFIQEVCKGDPSQLAALKVRFSKPARPGQTLTTRGFEPRDEEGMKVYPFTAVNDDGDQIITEGVAKIRQE